MKRIFSEVERKRLLKSQAELLKSDLSNCELLIRNKRYRGAYIFLFDALERLLDCYFVSKGVKPRTRREREELIYEHFTPLFLRRFRSFYYERRGGMYEDFYLITKRDLRALFRFFLKVFEEVEKQIKLKGVRDMIKKVESSMKRANQSAS